MKKRLIFIVSALLLVLIAVSSSYAYFNVLINDEDTDVAIEAGRLETLFTDGPEIIANDLLPGATIIKTFSVENTGTLSANYALELIDVINELNMKSDLVFSLTSSNGGATLTETEFPSDVYLINQSISIAPDTTHNYTLTIRYINQETNQSLDMNKLVTGTIHVIEEVDEFTINGIASINGELLTEGYVEVHSDVIKVPINSNGTFSIPNVPAGRHEIIFKDAEDEPIYTDNFTIRSGENITISNNNVIAKTDEPINLNFKLSDISTQITTDFTTYNVTIAEYYENELINSNVEVVYKNTNLHVAKNSDYDLVSISCTNDQQVTHSTDILISNLTNNTVCTINYEANYYTLKSTTSNDTTAFRANQYKQKIKTVTFSDTINIPNNAVATWDISVEQTGGIMAYVIQSNGKYDLYISSNKQIRANEDMSYWFYDIGNVDSIQNLDLVDTSLVTNMSCMFCSTGYESTVFTLDLGDNFDTSNVTNMSTMFSLTGRASSIFTLDLGDKFDTSKVTDMSGMFNYTGRESTVFTLDLGDEFDTSNVTNMSNMFALTGYICPIFTLDLGDKFDTSKVTTMDRMFASAGYKSTVFTLDLGDKFDTSNVTNMSTMFNLTGRASSIFTLDLGDKFDTSKVTDMSGMFNGTGATSPVFNLTLNLTNESALSSLNYNNIFYGVARNSTTGGITVNYSSALASQIDKLIATKNEGKVYKGVQLPD